MTEESIQKNISQMTKSLKQLEMDVWSAQQDKTVAENDNFLQIMTISFDLKVEFINLTHGLHRILICLRIGCDLSHVLCYIIPIFNFVAYAVFLSAVKIGVNR